MLVASCSTPVSYKPIPAPSKRILPVCPEHYTGPECRQLTASDTGTTIRGHSDDVDE